MIRIIHDFNPIIILLYFHVSNYANPCKISRFSSNSTSVFSQLCNITLLHYYNIYTVFYILILDLLLTCFCNCLEQLFTLHYNLDFCMTNLKSRPDVSLFNFVPTTLVLAHGRCSINIWFAFIWKDLMLFWYIHSLQPKLFFSVKEFWILRCWNIIIHL